jgi:hypothetical protein
MIEITDSFNQFWISFFKENKEYMIYADSEGNRLLAGTKSGATGFMTSGFGYKNGTLLAERKV